MLPEEFLQIINDLPAEDRAAYEKDLLYYGRGYVKMDKDGRYRRIDPADVENGPSTQSGELGG
jgi:hypothetical protein